MKRRWTDLISLVSRGTRVQFDIAVVLTSILPLLALTFLVTRGFWREEHAFGGYDIAMVVMIGLVVMGYFVLSRYPVTIIKLRRYLEDMVKGDLPVQIDLDKTENDITAIEECMNLILGEMKKKVEAMQREHVKLEMQLCQAHKLESIGGLASGMAHEVNTPIQFVGDNTRFLSEAVKDVLQLLKAYREVVAQCDSGRVPEGSRERLRAMEEDVDLPFIEKEIPAAIEQSLEGLDQAANVARAMKEFSHLIHENEKVETDLNKAIETTITVSRNEWKHVAEVKTDMDPSLPLVHCFPGDVEQALINLIVNAAHAIGDVVSRDAASKGRITVRTRQVNSSVVIAISDTGLGIPAGIRERIFEPFFTTKTGGKGTGQGLPITRSIIENKHGGKLTFETQTGKGTTFLVHLPLGQATAKTA